jgi:hypothetical protein
MKYVLEVLFPYIFLLYVFDCITYVKARHVLLTSLFGKKFELKGSGIHLAGWLPISRTIISHDLPIYYSRDGIHAVFDTPGSGNRIVKAEDFDFIKYEDLRFIEVEGKNIKFDNTRRIKTPSASSARFQAEFINQLKTSAPAIRRKKIKAHLSDSYDLEAIRKIETAGLKSFTILKILSSFLFVLVLLILPASLFSDLSEYIRLDAVIICMGLTYFPVLAVSLRTLKKLYPAENDLRSYTLSALIFSPINAVHVLSYLSRDLYFRFDYLAIAAYFLPRNSFKELARKEIFLIDRFQKEIEAEDRLKFWRIKKGLLLGLLDKRQIARHEISTPPQKQDQTAGYYCPFCRAEYREKRLNCIDCETALKAF